MPAFSGKTEGKLVRKSQLRRGIPSQAMSTSKTASTTSPIMVATNTSTVKIRSSVWRAEILDLKSALPCSGVPSCVARAPLFVAISTPP
jgi:hypothetical protein